MSPIATCGFFSERLRALIPLCELRGQVGIVTGKRNPAQPQLLFDPMPERVEPALAQLKSHPPRGSEWSWELKWDGYRLAVHIEPQGIRILTRGGLTGRIGFRR